MDWTPPLRKDKGGPTKLWSKHIVPVTYRTCDLSNLWRNEPGTFRTWDLSNLWLIEPGTYRNDPDSGLERFFSNELCTLCCPTGNFPMGISGRFPQGKPAATESRHPSLIKVYSVCWVNQSLCQSRSQSVNQSINQSINQGAEWFRHAPQLLCELVRSNLCKTELVS